MTPVPEHGASSKTRSKPPMTLGKARPSWLQMTTLRQPMRDTLADSALMRCLFESLAKTVPVFCSSAEM